MNKLLCKICNNPIVGPQWYTKHRKFCSKKCEGNFRRGKPLSYPVTWGYKISKSRKGKYKGRRNPNWKGGFIIVKGYKYIYAPEHPFNSGRKGYVLEHRLVIEKKIGRYLEQKEVVHHINEDKLDNRIENLKLYSSAGRHSITEHIKRNHKTGRFIH